MEIMDRLKRLPEFQCHKVVRAARIVGQVLPPVSQLELDPGDGGAENVWHEVPGEYFHKHRPEIGGYFVVYEGGYQSYSPAQAFEQGYAPLDPERALRDAVREEQHVARAQELAEARTENTALALSVSNLRDREEKQLEAIRQISAARDQLEARVKELQDSNSELESKLADHTSGAADVTPPSTKAARK